MNPFTKLATRFRRDGIRFTCTQCGDCCRVPGSVYFTLGEIRKAAGLLGISKAEFLQHYARSQSGALYEVYAEAACPFLDGQNGCRIYEARPTQCRSFPFWKSNFASEQALADLAAACPGIGQGRFHSSSEIADRIIGAEADFHLPER